MVAIESHRAAAYIVGEDLGTVEDGVRADLYDRRILSYRLLWFEEGDPAGYPAQSLAAVTTHDLPTVAGLWTGHDLDAQRSIGLPANPESTSRMRRRVAALAGVGETAPAAEAVESVYRLLARAPSMLLAATLEDAVLTEERPNMP